VDVSRWTSGRGPRLRVVTGPTQEALYSRLDLELSWSEDALPQAERTKHVHGLHPYLGKFVPQLVETFLHRHFRPGQCVYDPFCGSGTTLVEANIFGCDAIGCDISAFNCLIARVKTARHRLAALELALRAALRAARRPRRGPADAPAWAREWYAPDALAELLAYRNAVRELDQDAQEVAALVLSRAARSARLTTHYDLDFPRAPVRAPYWCHKHRRECRPVQEAGKFLRRYTDDTVRRLRAFAAVRSDRRVAVLHGDARDIELDMRPHGVITSPPYPGLIDYHEQHRYAYVLLDLPDRRADEIGAAALGRTLSALERYVDAMVEALGATAALLPSGAPVVIVVNDARDLYPTILERSGLRLEERTTRHVNRRTGRRAGEFFEHVLVCRVDRPERGTARGFRRGDPRAAR
jgi:hypothetical protein